MKHSEHLNELATALAKAQGQMEGALKASANPFYKSRYADLKSVWEACRKPLSDNGLSVVQAVRCEHQSPDVNALKQVADNIGLPPAVICTTMLMHSSGQWIMEELTMWPKENGPQPIGSCTSYARRYGLAAMIGIYQEDDDAESGQGRSGKFLEGDGVSGKEAVEYLKQVATAISADDAHGAREIWGELDQQGQADVWKLLNTKQKSALRELLQRVPPDRPEETTPEETS